MTKARFKPRRKVIRISFTVPSREPGRSPAGRTGWAIPIKPGHVDHRLGEGLRRFLRQIVPDAAGDQAVGVFAGELVGVGLGSGCGAPLASPSMVMVGTAMTGDSASRVSSAS